MGPGVSYVPRTQEDMCVICVFLCVFVHVVVVTVAPQSTHSFVIFYVLHAITSSNNSFIASHSRVKKWCSTHACRLLNKCS